MTLIEGPSRIVKLTPFRDTIIGPMLLIEGPYGLRPQEPERWHILIYLELRLFFSL